LVYTKAIAIDFAFCYFAEDVHYAQEFCGGVPGSFMYKIMLSENRDSLTSFPI
jgi:hypothetical protein